MHQLTGRLTALDPDAGAALQVISYFDELLDQRAGLESIVRGAAVLTGTPARLMTPSRSTALRVGPDGRRSDETGEPAPDWLCEEIPGCGVTLWLERGGEPGPVEAMVLERATQAARAVLERTHRRHVEPRQQDGELMEVLLDPESSGLERAHAVRALGFRPGQIVQVHQPAGRRPTVLPVGSALPESEKSARVGVGVAVPVEQAAQSARTALAALRLAADGEPTTPGPTTVHASGLGAILLLVAGYDLDPHWRTHPDVLAIARSSQRTDWVISTLHALAFSVSLRAAATELHVHHSTLQTRLSRIQQDLGWDLTTAEGKFRLQIALTVRLLDTRASDVRGTPDGVRERVH